MLFIEVTYEWKTYAHFIIDNAGEATKYIKELLGEHYFYDDKPVLRALWDNYNSCQFVEDEGEFSVSSTKIENYKIIFRRYFIL